MVNKLTLPAKQNEVVSKVNELVDNKQDVLTSENAGNCIEIATGGSSGLPSEYQELEYLQSSGTQWIDTGVYGTDKTSVQVKYSCTASTDNNGAGIIGFQTGFQTSPTFQRVVWTEQNNNQFRYANLVKDTNKRAITNTIYEETFGNGSWILNGESIPLSTSGAFTTSPNTLYLFVLRTPDSLMSRASIRLYYCSIKENDTLVRNFIPARRNSDNVLGLYDTVTGTFFTNLGTGTFIAGGDVEETTKISFVNDAGYITSADLPTNHVTTDTAQDVSGNKTFTGVTKFQNGSANGCVVLGADVSETTVSNNVRKLGRMSFHTYENTVDCAFVSTDSINGVNYVEFGGRAGDTTNTSPDILRFTVATIHNAGSGKKTVIYIDKDIANFGVQPKYNNVNLATETYVTSQGYITSSALTPYVLSSSLATVATSGSYNDLSNKPTIPTVNNPTITFTQGGTTKGTITLNQSGDQTIAFDAGGGGSDVEAFTAAEVQAIWEAN